VEIRQLDPHDEPLVRRHWEIGHAAESAHRPYDMFWPWESAWATHDQERDDVTSVLIGAFEDGRMWGAGQVDMPLHDNTHLGFGEFFVHPDRERRGIGRLVAQAGEDVVRQAGRRLLVVEAYAPPGAESAALGFGRALGYTEAIEEGMKVVDLVATEPTWDDLASKAAPHHAGYRLITWHDTVPDEMVAAYCRMNEAFNDEAPLGDLDMETERWDEERVRSREARNAAAGRHVVATAAVSPDGEVVGMTEIGLNVNAPWRGMQSGTLVMPAHRGHRLGLAMKLANQRAVRAAHPDIEVLFTGNAGVNAPMNAVNDVLGYRFVERCVEMQKNLA